MATNAREVPHILFFGLSNDLAEALKSALPRDGHVVTIRPQLAAREGWDWMNEAHVLFCGADPECYRPALEWIKQAKRRPAVIVVSRQPEIAEWLAALEAGADDYCVPPFEPVPVRWMLDSAQALRAAV